MRVSASSTRSGDDSDNPHNPLLTSRLEFFGVLVDEIANVRVVAEFSFADLQARLVERGGHLVGVLGATPLALGRYGVVLGEVAERVAV